MSTCHRRKAGRKRCRVGTMSLATSCDITRHHVIGSGWRKMSFDRRRCGRETRWREWERKAGGSRKWKRKTGGSRKWKRKTGGRRKWKRKTGGRRKRKGFPLHLPYCVLLHPTSFSFVLPHSTLFYCVLLSYSVLLHPTSFYLILHRLTAPYLILPHFTSPHCFSTLYI